MKKHKKKISKLYKNNVGKKYKKMLKNNTWIKIYDENLKGKKAYMNLISNECIDIVENKWIFNYIDIFFNFN